MVLQKTVDHLKTRPRHERRAVARAIAMLVVATLFIGWAILFFKDIRANGIQIEPIDIPVREALNTPQAAEARIQIQNSFGGVRNGLESMQNSAALQQDAAAPAQTIY